MCSSRRRHPVPGRSPAVAMGLGVAVVMAALSSALGGESRALADCAPTWFAPVLVTDVRVPLPPTFALTALLTSDFRHPEFRERPFGAPALTRRGERIPLRVEEIGAGAARLVPESEPGPGLWRVEGLLSPDSVRVVRGATLPPPPRPPSDVELQMPFIRSLHLPTGARVRGVDAFFPDGSRRHEILLGYWDDQLAAATRVRPHDERVTLFRPGSDCAPLPPGVAAPRPSANRALAWLDGWGRISELARH